MDKRLIIKILIILVPLELLLWYHVFNNSEGTSDNNLEEISDIRYYGKDFFLLEGTEIADSLKESRYDRLPLSLKNVVREPVWNLSKSSAGMSIRFLSNTLPVILSETISETLDSRGCKSNVTILIPCLFQVRYVSEYRVIPLSLTVRNLDPVL